MADKVTNDAVAYIRGIAEQRGRNADWGEQAVRESVSLEGNAAVEERVVDFVAPNLESLINDLDGRTVTLPAGDVTISTTGAPIVPVDMNFIEIFLFAISDPNVAYLLLSLAMLALFLEFSNPGAMLPGIIGAICLLTALFGLGMLPVNIAGLLLMLLGFALLVAEVWVVSHGLFAIGGIVAVTNWLLHPHQRRRAGVAGEPLAHRGRSERHGHLLPLRRGRSGRFPTHQVSCRHRGAHWSERRRTNTLGSRGHYLRPRRALAGPIQQLILSRRGSTCG